MKSPFLRCVSRFLFIVAMAAPVLAQAQQEPNEPRTPDPAFSEMVIKNTVIALNQANLTGNYSVLRELGTPAFQAENSSARLSDAFARLRQQGLDMSGVVLLEPNLTTAIRQGNQMRLTGYFPSAPLRIRFDAFYVGIDGKMRLHALSVSPDAEAAASQQGGTAPAGRSDFGATDP